ncbi:hypothetical protein ATE80_21625 [Streptomyces kanasensis]|uniref:Uncharacterized protein n=1 Tax=Streptomyces kanasensis TaxID=936756 RepID=A0A100Y306_9ACTN|nr:hypothetical protein ATE80_21625 [Streptomyces kanasensis]
MAQQVRYLRLGRGLVLRAEERMGRDGAGGVQADQGGAAGRRGSVRGCRRVGCLLTLVVLGHRKSRLHVSGPG